MKKLFSGIASLALASVAFANDSKPTTAAPSATTEHHEGETAEEHAVHHAEGETAHVEGNAKHAKAKGKKAKKAKKEHTEHN